MTKEITPEQEDHICEEGLFEWMEKRHWESKRPVESLKTKEGGKKK